MNTFEHIKETVQVDMTSAEHTFLLILLKHVRDEEGLNEAYQNALSKLIYNIEFKRKIVKQRL